MEIFTFIFEFFKNNLVNWLILVGLIVWAIQKAVPAMVEKRAKAIDEAIEASNKAKTEAEEFLKEQTEKVANAEAEAANILEEAKVVAVQMKKEMIAQTESDIASLKHKFDAAIENERQVVVTETRKAAVKAAMKLSEGYLRSNISDSQRAVLMNQFVQELDSIGNVDKSMVLDKGKVGSGSSVK